MPRVDLALPFAQRLVAPGSEGARLDVFYPASQRSTGPVTFRTMIRQAAMAFAQALASSAQETLHSHTTAMMPVIADTGA